MYCLSVAISCPDYKRPSFEVKNYFFNTENEAYEELKQCKLNFINDFGNTDSIDIMGADETIEKLFNEVSDPEDFYSDSYMSNDPFSYKIEEVRAGLVMRFH